MVYVCGKCGAEVKSTDDGIVRCFSCGHKILYKKRDSIAKTIKVD